MMQQDLQISYSCLIFKISKLNIFSEFNNLQITDGYATVIRIVTHTHARTHMRARAHAHIHDKSLR